MRLEDYQRRWAEKPALRAVYDDLHSRMERVSVTGPSLEIGGGIGNFGSGRIDLLRMDIQKSSGVQVVADAHRLPFANMTFSNIYLFDVLHHLQCPSLFFAETARVLRVNGRIIMVEPGITPLSGLLYGMGHEEPVDMSWKPELKCVLDSHKDPYASNQAIPTILFKRSPQLFSAMSLSLRVSESRWLSLFVYPLTGGFKSWSLMPVSCVKPLLCVEEILLPLLGRLMAFRLMIILEKVD